MFPITLEEHNGITVLRDDLIGGTKSIYVWKILEEFPAETYCLATNVEGGFQLALAKICKERDKRLVIVTPKRKVRHKHTLLVRSMGAELIEVSVNAFLIHLQKVARDYCRDNPETVNITFGANYPFAIDALAARMREITAMLGYEPDRVYCAVGSGTLLRGILKGTDTANVIGVLVGKEHIVEEFGERVTLIRHRLLYRQDSKYLCPFPSNPTYERKAWEIANQDRSGRRILFWNVL